MIRMRKGKEKSSGKIEETTKWNEQGKDEGKGGLEIEGGGVEERSEKSGGPIDEIVNLTWGVSLSVIILGNWELTNNDYILITTDTSTELESNYEILSIQSNSAFINGTIPFSQEIMGFSFDLQIDVEMQLIKE